MRFHILHPQHTVNNKNFNGCAYTAKAYKMCKMLTERGHTVFHYGTEGGDPPCTENVVVLPKSDWEISYGEHDYHSKFFKFDLNDHAYKVYNKNAIEEISKRKQKNDFILPFWGAGNREICDAHSDLITVEPGIGYAGGSWARFKIFESYAIYHAYCGTESIGTCKQDWYHQVIPNYFDPDDFQYTPEEKEDYFLFLGRVYAGKGVNIAVQVTESIGAKLIIAGQESLKDMGYEKTPDHVTEIGYADVETRKKLMAKAKGAFVASIYNEPFGGVQVECLLSGTPTITTPWGAFSENNIHGITGYKCNNFEQFTWAAKNIDKIKPENCRLWGENFTLDKVAPMYEEYFQSVLNVYNGNGWYEPNPDRTNLDYMSKNYSFYK